MTDKALADIRQLLGDASAAGAVKPRLILYIEGGEVWAYLQAEARPPGSTWETEPSSLPTAAAWPAVLDELREDDVIDSLLDEPEEDTAVLGSPILADGIERKGG